MEKNIHQILCEYELGTSQHSDMLYIITKYIILKIVKISINPFKKLIQSNKVQFCCKDKNNHHYDTTYS